MSDAQTAANNALSVAQAARTKWKTLWEANSFSEVKLGNTTGVIELSEDINDGDLIAIRWYSSYSDPPTETSEGRGYGCHVEMVQKLPSWCSVDNNTGFTIVGGYPSGAIYYTKYRNCRFTGNRQITYSQSYDSSENRVSARDILICGVYKIPTTHQ